VFDTVRYLLLQIRNNDDAMRGHEVGCFARALRTTANRVDVFDLLTGVPSRTQLDTADVVVLGGSGDYSVAAGGDWLEPALDAMRELHGGSKPTFASCWGFQAMARALGGAVVTDPSRAELGTLEIALTDAGRTDAVFGGLPDPFRAVMGHQDIVDTLPEGAVLLASTDRVTNQAFCFSDKPIYCTQFHPELTAGDLLTRLRAYPSYVETIAGVDIDTFAAGCTATLGAEALLPRFVELVLTGG